MFLEQAKQDSASKIVHRWKVGSFTIRILHQKLFHRLKSRQFLLSRFIRDKETTKGASIDLQMAMVHTSRVVCTLSQTHKYSLHRLLPTYLHPSQLDNLCSKTA
ncbi:hypothetical protein AFLA_007283 [Aspergillus flavus NRRL3357]|nr:hypothetical protein AFLA_007283 [Aspergillus flavus NRRL3357]